MVPILALVIGDDQYVKSNALFLVVEFSNFVMLPVIEADGSYITRDSWSPILKVPLIVKSP